MKKLILLFLVLLVTLPYLFGQEEQSGARIAVLPPANTTDDSQYDSIGRTIADTINLTLKMLGLYTLVDISVPGSALDEKETAALARENRLDNLVFGKILQGENNTIVFDVSVYDRGEDAIIVNHQEKAESFFETFEAADRIVMEVVESFSDTHIGWGTILLSNEGEAGDYEIYIDGAHLGSSQKNLSNILAGKRTLELIQNRPFGEYVLLDETVEVAEDAATVVSFSIPSVSEEEKERFGAIDEEIIRAWDAKDPTMVEQQFSLAFTLLDGATVSTGLVELKEKYIRWLADYNNSRAASGDKTDVTDTDDAVIAEVPMEMVEPQVGRRIAGGSLLGLGVVLGAGSLVDYIIAAEMRYKSEESWADYMESTGNVDSLYTAYQDEYDTYKVAGILAHSFAAASTALVAASLFILPEEHFTLSAGGRVTASASVVLGAAGNMFHMMANNQKHRNLELWDDYSSASEDLDTLYRAYEDGVEAYTTSRVLSLSLWSAGIAGFGASFLFPGEKTPAVPTLMDKILVSAGLLMLSGGNVTASMSSNYLLQADDAWDDYRNASTGLDDLYQTYNSRMDNYKLTTYLSYGLWGAGTAAILTALIVPFTSKNAAKPAKERPVELSIEPSAAGGMTLQIKGRLP